ncbi:hypothetical protein CBW65_18540 [Tumebacillus avium]|uniref:Uncharacterized protein n=1 Tax=Tumebacillus avium TaxID=1903704 RepID=A0A1Y0IQD9_9BACL|nr:hypothetical protein CBW65_18540 [Tumebacillus avium]
MGFQYGSGLLPVKKVFVSPRVIGFYHPKPSYSRHMLFVPKRAVSTLEASDVVPGIVGSSADGGERAGN